MKLKKEEIKHEKSHKIEKKTKIEKLSIFKSKVFINEYLP